MPNYYVTLPTTARHFVVFPAAFCSNLGQHGGMFRGAGA
jgi:hypothetical protein